MAKLTLNADPEVIAQAKRLAADSQTSVSALFSRFVLALAKASGGPRPIGKLARKAAGTIELGEQSERDVLADSLLDKYKPRE